MFPTNSNILTDSSSMLRSVKSGVAILETSCGRVKGQTGKHLSKSDAVGLPFGQFFTRYYSELL